MNKQPSFVHLSLHSEYSIVDGLVRIDALGQAVQAGKMAAVALTDHCNLFATIKFYQKMLSQGIKPIIGCDVFIQTQMKSNCLRLLVQNNQGHKNLIELVSRAYKENQVGGIPLIKPSWLQRDACEGLIALSGGLEGELAHHVLTNEKKAWQALIKEIEICFPERFYLEVSRLGQAQETLYLERILDIAYEENLPLVATNQVRFLTAADFEAHEARVCINQGDLLSNPQRVQSYSDQQYLRSATEMATLFADLPEALVNTVEIAKRCSLSLTLGTYYLPRFNVTETLSEGDQLAQAAEGGLKTRLILIDSEAQTAYWQRLKEELKVINEMGFPGYFLIVADFIQWAKNNDIPVGPGRGSGAGSLVAYALGITDIDPLKYDLLFERFLNPERVSMPDFDIDFCMEGRDRVIEYVAQRYGRSCVAQIITYGTMAAKAVVRDVGRVLAYPYGFVDKLAKLIPFELGITLEKALDQEEALIERYGNEEEVREIIDLAKKLEGLTRNAGKHAGGVVIAPTALTDFVALYYEENSEVPVTQFDKDDIETVGLIKFDFLGLRTLTIIHSALAMINQKQVKKNQSSVDIATIPLDDVATFNLLKACNTTAVFQLESRGMKDLIHRLQPDCFEEIVALVALFRPGPLQSGMVDDFINRKHGYEPVEYLHPNLESILCSTYGVILYQEQVMQIAQLLAGYSLGGADLLRRAMGKKKPEAMAKQREIFLSGARERGIEKKLAVLIFDLMEKFAGYGFNKSHSVAYALIAYQTAWLKTHYPAEFMAAVLSSDMDNTDKVVTFINECKAMGVTVKPPDINLSCYQFIPHSDTTIHYGLGAIKGVGEGAVAAIIKERETGGKFTDLFEFCHRVDLKKLNRRTLEALVRSGALDGLGDHRASLFFHLEKAVHNAEQVARNHTLGQHDLFSEETQQNSLTIQYEPVKSWHQQQLLLGEKETLGCYFSGHPIHRYVDELKALDIYKVSELTGENTTAIKIAGFITSIRSTVTKRGDRMAFLTIEDDHQNLSVTVFSEAYQTSRDLLHKHQLVVIEGIVEKDEQREEYSMVANSLYDIEKLRNSQAKAINLYCNPDTLNIKLQEELGKILTVYQGGECPIQIVYQHAKGEGELQLGKEWWVFPKDEVLDSLIELLGENQVRVIYS